MPKPTKGPRLGGSPAHERLILANLAQQLFEHESITTTETRARRLQPYAERLVTFAKKGDLQARRRVLQDLSDKSIVHRLFTEIAPQVADRQGGYTRIVKLGFRKGDNAPLAAISLVLDPIESAQSAFATAQAPAGDTEAVEVDGVEGAAPDVQTKGTEQQIEAEATAEAEAADAAEKVAEPAADETPSDGAPSDEASAGQQK